MHASVSKVQMSRHTHRGRVLRAQGAVDAKEEDGCIGGLSAKNKIQADQTGLENMRTSDTTPDVRA